MLSVPSTQTPALAFAGIDWGHKEHAVSVLDAHGKRHQKRFRHSADGCLGLRRWLTSFTADPASLLVAIERPDHPLAELLAEAGVGVYSINPRQVDRLRDRHWVSGAKDDGRDALLLADALRGDLPLFRLVTPPSDGQLLLRETARRLTRLNRDLVALANRLGAVLGETAPEVLDLCGGANEPFFWDLAELATDDRIARRLRQSQVQKILSRHRIRRLGAEAVLAALKTPRLWRSWGRKQADLEEIASLLPRLRATHQQAERCRARLEALLEEAGPDAAILRSFPGLGPTVAATLLGEASQAIEERDLQGLRSRCGVAPVTKRSGTSGAVSMRRACSGALRDACFYWARTAARVDPWARDLYQRARARGQSEGRALRTLGDRLLARLVAALRSGTTYQPPAPPAAGPPP